jgi:anti-sigma factor RsiW
MKHYTYDEWLQYVRDEIHSENRDELENHLYTCDTCLEHYLQAIAVNESSLPTLSNDSSFTDAVMAGVTKEKVRVPDKQKDVHKSADTKPFYQQAAFHYLLAAAATLLLTFTGAFQSLATYAGAFETKQIQQKRPSMTEGVMNKTFAWMDSLEKKEADRK